MNWNSHLNLKFSMICWLSELWIYKEFRFQFDYSKWLIRKKPRKINGGLNYCQVQFSESIIYTQNDSQFCSLFEIQFHKLMLKSIKRYNYNYNNVYNQTKIHTGRCKAWRVLFRANPLKIPFKPLWYSSEYCPRDDSSAISGSCLRKRKCSSKTAKCNKEKIKYFEN